MLLNYAAWQKKKKKKANIFQQEIKITSSAEGGRGSAFEKGKFENEGGV